LEEEDEKLEAVKAFSLIPIFCSGCHEATPGYRHKLLPQSNELLCGVR
jgi:hypothetical protein